MYKMLDKDILWEKLGKRDFPYFIIKNKREYKLEDPMYVSRKELEWYIKENSVWTRYWMEKKVINRNGLIDHRYREYVFSICRNLLRVEKYKKIKSKYKGGGMDWKIAINIIIDELLNRSEAEEIELKSI